MLLRNLIQWLHNSSLFQAANPGCDLIDFIRWHSPKDFDEETGEKVEKMLRFQEESHFICCPNPLFLIVLTAGFARENSQQFSALILTFPVNGPGNTIRINWHNYKMLRITRRRDRRTAAKKLAFSYGESRMVYRRQRTVPGKSAH